MKKVAKKSASRTHGRSARGRAPGRATRERAKNGKTSATHQKPSAKRKSSRRAEHRTPMRRSKGIRRSRVTAPPPEARASRFRPGSPRRRLIAALVVMSLVMLAIVARVAFLQTTEAETLRSAGADQWTRSYDIAAQRGTVFDRHGNELAMSVPAVSV